jgi:hypothetical protein
MMTICAALLVFSLCGRLGAEIPPRARELHQAGSLLGDRTKLREAWQLAPCPEIAASLTETWLYELGADLDEELVGTPPFLGILALWEELEPDNALIPCLRELFRSARESRLPAWARLKEEIEWKRRIHFHFAPVRRDALHLVLKRRDNVIRSWLRWLGQAPLTNVGRVVRLGETCLLEARFKLLTGDADGAKELIALASAIAEKMSPEDDEITVRKLSLRGGVLQEEILLDLAAGGGKNVEELISRFRANLEQERALVSRLAVLANLQTEFARAYAWAYQEIRTATWNDVASVDAGVMAAFAGAFVEKGAAAIDDFWTYRKVPLDDFTQALEKHLDVFREKELTRATAGRLMDFLRANVAAEKGIPTWVIPAFTRVKGVYRNAAVLGRKTVPERHEPTYAWVTGALSFLAEEDGDSEKWVKAFRMGQARPYLLLAFAKRRTASAVPAIIEALEKLTGEAPGSALLDYVLCLRTLTGQDFGLNAEKWRAWYDKAGKK